MTGSNADFLSKDIATELGGRSDEIHMYPLSFSEFMTYYAGSPFEGWNEYITYGGGSACGSGRNRRAEDDATR